MAHFAQPLRQLMAQGAVWQGYREQAKPLDRVTTGSENLDLCLGGGWAKQRLHEIQTPRPFIGEVALCLPAIGESAQIQRPIFWIAPPALPYPQGLSQATSAEGQHIVLTPKHMADTLWAAEQILSSGVAGVVLLWASDLSQAACRRLHLAAQSSHALTFVFAGLQSDEARPYASRLRLTPGSSEVSVLKRAGGWPVTICA
ncbi:MAG: hypothetical protein JJU10_11040 [Idiomarina sp.]|nr:hypothetical protein [Idiomarina sp.]